MHGRVTRARRRRESSLEVGANGRRDDSSNPTSVDRENPEGTATDGHPTTARSAPSPQRLQSQICNVSDVAVVEPALFVAVTTTRMSHPGWPSSGVYFDSVGASWMFQQVVPLQCCHRNV